MWTSFEGYGAELDYEDRRNGRVSRLVRVETTVEAFEYRDRT
jgi:hypothetical protein